MLYVSSYVLNLTADVDVPNLFGFTHRLVSLATKHAAGLQLLI